jgi:hypothetical protein
MNQLLRFLSLAAFTVTLLMAGRAQAAVICTTCPFVAPATFLGVHAAGDTSFFDSGSATGVQTFVFNLSAARPVAINATFSSTTGNSLSLYTGVGGSCGTPGSACTGFTLGSLIASATFSSATVASIPLTPLTTGRYAIVVTGTILGSGPRPDGIPDLLAGGGLLAVQAVPEPAAWTLMLGGLLGLAAWRRRQECT